MATPDPAPKCGQLVFFGDSLFQQSVDLQNGFSMYTVFSKLFIRQLDVINRGFSGWNTNNAVSYLDKIFPEPTPSSPKTEIMVVLFGANDAVLKGASTRQHVPIEEFKENLRIIIKHKYNYGDEEPIKLIVTPPPVDEIKLLQEARDDELNREVEVTAKYAQAVREVAGEVAKTQPKGKVKLVDLYYEILERAKVRARRMTGGYDRNRDGPLGKKGGKQGGLKVLLTDGLHLSEKGYRVFCDILVEPILEWWQKEPKADRKLIEKWLEGLRAGQKTDDWKIEEWLRGIKAHKPGYVFPDWQVFMNEALLKEARG